MRALGGRSRTASKDRYLRITILLTILLLILSMSLVVLPGCGGEKEETGLETEETTVDTEDEMEEDGETEETEEIELGMEYTNDKWYFKISYPESWSCTDILNGDGCSITDSEHENWEVLAWSEPAQGKTPEEFVNEYYTMMSTTFDTQREDGSMETGTWDEEDYAYDYWTRVVPVNNNEESYYEVFAVERDNKMFIVTADYPVEELEEAEPYMIAIFDSFELPGREAK